MAANKERQWTVIYQTPSPMDADLVRTTLEVAGYPVWVQGGNQPSVATRTLTANGRVFFIDELSTEQTRGMEQRLEGDGVVRELEDGRQFRAVKVFHEPAELEAKLHELGWNIDVRPAGRRFYWGRSIR